MLHFPRPLILFLFVVTAAAEQRVTAFTAFQSLPSDAALHLAKIASCEGSPHPARWHFIVYAPQTEDRLRDYVIADAKIAAVNVASQFAQEVRREDVLLLNSLRIDSSYVAQVAAQYATASSVSIASMNYELHKDERGKPVWEVTCFGSSDQFIGRLTIDAGDGRVVRQDGFEVTTTTRPMVSAEPTVPEPDPDVPAGGSQRTDALAQPRDARPSANRPREIEVRRAVAVEKAPPPERRRIAIDPLRPIRRLFPF